MLVPEMSLDQHCFEHKFIFEIQRLCVLTLFFFVFGTVLQSRLCNIFRKLSVHLFRNLFLDCLWCWLFEFFINISWFAAGCMIKNSLAILEASIFICKSISFFIGEQLFLWLKVWSLDVFPAKCSEFMVVSQNYWFLFRLFYFFL